MRRKACLLNPADSIAFSVGAQPRVDYGAQPGIGGCHPATLDLFKQFDERVGLGDSRDGTLQCLIA